MTNKEKKEYVHALTDYNLFVICRSRRFELNAFELYLLKAHLFGLKARYLLFKGFSWKNFTKNDWSIV